ncbi:MAG: helix-turn-helix domain-containing protein [Candidatus Eremiobacteraeota bacterium]|nr:helix-turn-helix domain-containing protein [Candidatus Eremiobacteraeota bacterium]
MNTQITTTPTATLLADLLDDLRERRHELGLSLNALAEAIDKSPIYVGAVLSGQAQLTAATATKLANALSIDESSLAPLTLPPVRNSDPLVYRLHELIDVYGDAIREWTFETFGDGILSAIDLKIAVERRGERAVITLDSKFLAYREF